MTRDPKIYPVRSIPPKGGHEVRLATKDWMKVCGGLAIQVVALVFGLWRLSIALENRITKLETRVEANQIMVMENVHQLREDVRQLK